jgi:hypothetical protein
MYRVHTTNLWAMLLFELIALPSTSLDRRFRVFMRKRALASSLIIESRVTGTVKVPGP